jgi:hypothetical protein
VVSVGLGGMLPVRTLKPCVTGFGLDTSGWTEPDAVGLTMSAHAAASEVYPASGCLCDPAPGRYAEAAVAVAFCWCL